MAYQTDFNSSTSTVMHIDLNSCFASVEQQANPLLRGKPIAVAAYDSPGGCILASSIEAKRYGIKTGFRVKEAKIIYPNLVVLTPDPNKYRQVHLSLRKILRDYTQNFFPKSIDEFVLHFSPSLFQRYDLTTIASEIKFRIKKEVGNWLTVSIGISTNRFLAKTASNLKKPDGLDEINKDNFLRVYKNLTLKDLYGINTQNESRLKSVKINTVLEFYQADIWQLRAAFHSVLADYWHARLRGFEVDNIEFNRRSFGNSFALPHHNGSRQDLLPILQKLVERTGSRLRAAEYKVSGVHLGLFFRNRSYWHKSKKLPRVIFDSRDIYKEMTSLLSECKVLYPVHTISETCFGLVRLKDTQLELFENTLEKSALVNAIDKTNNRWGEFAITPARALLAADKVKDRIAFGGIKEL